MAIISTIWYAFLAMIGLTVLPEKSSTPFIDPAQVIPSDGVCPDATFLSKKVSRKKAVQ